MVLPVRIHSAPPFFRLQGIYLAPSFIERRDRRCRKCFTKRYRSAAPEKKAKIAEHARNAGVNVTLDVPSTSSTELVPLQSVLKELHIARIRQFEVTAVFRCHPSNLRMFLELQVSYRAPPCSDQINMVLVRFITFMTQHIEGPQRRISRRNDSQFLLEFTDQSGLRRFSGFQVAAR